MATPPDREQIHKLALDEAERGVAQQQTVLEQIRTRAVGLVAVGSGVATFVGVRVTGLEGFSLAVYLFGVATYAGTLAMAAYLLWPRTWVFSNDASKIIADVDDVDDIGLPGEFGRYVRDLALFTEGHRKRNKAQLDCLMKVYSASIVLLGAEVGCWLLVALLR